MQQDKHNSPQKGHSWRYMQHQWRRFFGLNVTRVEPLLFVGGEFRANQWPLLYAQGVRAVLNLQAEHEDQFTGPPPERTLRLFVPDYHAPTLEQLADGVAFIRAAHADALPVLVHCHAGVGRAPLTTAAYLMSARGMNQQAAIAYLRASRPIVHINWVQSRRLREWEQHIRTGA